MPDQKKNKKKIFDKTNFWIEFLLLRRKVRMLNQDVVATFWLLLLPVFAGAVVAAGAHDRRDGQVVVGRQVDEVEEKGFILVESVWKFITDPNNSAFFLLLVLFQVRFNAFWLLFSIYD